MSRDKLIFIKFFIDFLSVFDRILLFNMMFPYSRMNKISVMIFSKEISAFFWSFKSSSEQKVRGKTQILVDEFIIAVLIQWRNRNDSNFGNIRDFALNFISLNLKMYELWTSFEYHHTRIHHQWEDY